MGEPSESQGLEAYAEFHLTECEATFKVKNFVAAVAATDTVYRGYSDFREITSCPIMSAGDFKFAIVMLWGLDERGRPDAKQKIGVCGRRVDESTETCTLSMVWKLVNQTESNSCSGVDRGFFRHPKGHDRGRLPWGESSSTLVSLAEACDGSKGWLHDGALHIKMKLAVVTNSSASSTVESGSSAKVLCDLRGVSDDLGKLFESRLFSDITVVVGEEVIEAHQNVLASRSPVFAATLAHNTQEVQSKRIIVKDLDPAAVKEMIWFLYTGRVKPKFLETDGLCMSLLQAAHRYKVDGLVVQCTESIGQRLEIETVCEILEFSDMFECENLKQRCLHFIHHHMGKVQLTDGYTNLSRRPSLLMDIIAALMPPTKRHGCKRRKVEGDASTSNSPSWKEGGK